VFRQSNSVSRLFEILHSVLTTREDECVVGQTTAEKVIASPPCNVSAPALRAAHHVSTTQQIVAPVAAIQRSFPDPPSGCHDCCHVQRVVVVATDNESNLHCRSEHHYRCLPTTNLHLNYHSMCQPGVTVQRIIGQSTVQHIVAATTVDQIKPAVAAQIVIATAPFSSSAPDKPTTVSLPASPFRVSAQDRHSGCHCPVLMS
jgi:hypothetical protein